jgi:hypothetical protein
MLFVVLFVFFIEDVFCVHNLVLVLWPFVAESQQMATPDEQQPTPTRNADNLE